MLVRGESRPDRFKMFFLDVEAAIRVGDGPSYEQIPSIHMTPVQFSAEWRMLAAEYLPHISVCLRSAGQTTHRVERLRRVRLRRRDDPADRASQVAAIVRQDGIKRVEIGEIDPS